MSVSFPGETAPYREARNRMLDQEAELRRVTEAAAAARRNLPPGGVVPQDCRRPEGRGTDRYPDLSYT